MLVITIIVLCNSLETSEDWQAIGLLRVGIQI